MAFPWLMNLISNVGVRAYYRVTVAGARIPSEGPVLLVANHNNSLIDPALVVVAADRTVRFMAKEPLFRDPMIGWLVKGVGSVPVYRQQDDPTKLSQNLDSFRDVHAVLARGDAVGIFPEGISHSSSQLAPLKTGAARIAIGAGQIVGTDFPIVAMGLVFRDRDAFRSEAHVIITEPFRWDDLLAKGVENRDAVRELTRRIEGAMRRVTLNLEQWEDEPLVRAAEQVWAAEYRGDPADPVDEVERLRMTTDALAALRTGGDDAWRTIAAELQAHMRELTTLGLTPSELKGDVRVGEAVEWTVARLPFAVVLPVSFSGAIVFGPPKALTSAIAARMSATEGEETLVTYRVLVGAVVFAAWFLLVAAVVWYVLGLGWALFSIVAQPLWAFAALAVGERRQQAWESARRFLLRRRERPRLEVLREQQRALAERLDRLYERVVAAPS
jgi:glycerol-3-phosphate O-acyltransferase / dihydroxyacetone phosphate acyltransferase